MQADRLEDAAVKAEFMRQLNVTDHPYSFGVEPGRPCCNAAPSRHLGYGNLPWRLPPIKEMRSLLEDPSDAG